MEYKFSDIEKEVKEFWKLHDVYHVETDISKPKYYALDFFPYPSGAGLHVGHPLGYIASDIYARYKRLKGFNVLHPMGFDSFGLPAEQYAIQTGQHPALTTEKNIQTFKEQLDKIGFSYDWSREIKTHDPEFYKWTQWIFIKFFHSWYNNKTDKAEPISALILEFAQNGNENIDAICSQEEIFSAYEWTDEFSEKKKSEVLLNYRIAYLADSWVNWCAALGTVLANDEVKDGVSERGGYPVERKLMKQWSLRITAYAERLLNGLDKIDWSEAIKESQRNWIGKSEGCSLWFEVKADSKFSSSEFPIGFVRELRRSKTEGLAIEVFTTRPDTIFGATFITLAPEHELVEKITTSEYKNQVEEYVTYAKNRSERDRMTDIKKITGQFTGTYAIHPFSGKQIPIWIGEYVLATYGTGAVMGVPGHDERDHRFAKHFGLEIISILEGVDVSEKSFDDKDGIVCHSDFLNGLSVPDAIKKAIDEIEEEEIGKRKVNYKLRDAIFGRQRYWGEPIPIYYAPAEDSSKAGDEELIPHTVDENDLPVVLPEVDKYLPTETGEPPLARAKDWKYKGKFEYELTTMPGWAGSNWYYLRYEDPNNKKKLASKEAINYWQNIDLYLGGDEHATGHLMYFRFCTKFLFDLGVIPFDEPAKKLVNQGKIQGVSEKIYYLSGREGDLGTVRANTFLFVQNNLPETVFMKYFNFDKNADRTYVVYSGERNRFDYFQKENSRSRNVPINLVENNVLNVEAFCKGDNSLIGSVFIVEAGFYLFDYDGSFKFEKLKEGNKSFYTFSQPEKMSKRWNNVVDPSDVVLKYGADCFRLYEMFLGPLEQSKPWDTKGIDGCFRFLKKFWKLFYNDEGNWMVTDEEPTKDELKILHYTIKKAGDDIEAMSFNTSVSAFMICVNELSQLNTHKKKILEPLLIILSPFAPFITEKLWKETGNTESIVKASFPQFDKSLLVETAFEYPIAVNGKTRSKINLPLDLTQEQVEKEVLSLEELKKYFDGKPPKKIIYVKGRMINVVV